MKHFDIIVVGGGHAGLEAAHIAAQFNLAVAIITMPQVPLGSAPCNPSVGGVGKGQVVRELDALGGLMGILADRAGIQYRTLNESKGFAVQSSRVQIDKECYSQQAEAHIAQIANITVLREKVISVHTDSADFIVQTTDRSYRTSKLIMTVGTFLNGKLHTGSKQQAGGRIECEASPGLNTLFSQIKTAPARFKTGTPPRLKATSINYSVLEEQPSDPQVRNFHCLHPSFQRVLPQVSCFLARTNQQTMEVIRANKELSPMFNGQIQATGARYCPSIEDKAYRYPDKNIHHVFLEPEGLGLPTIYPSGISSSLPEEVQEAYVRTMLGLEQAEIEVFGYAVEYDVIDTTELKLTLEHHLHAGLYFAGQVNGTSGYEEAAGQGLVAGANAALALQGLLPLILSRHDSYIGVMIEDLTSNTRDEPYRLFTSRSENRLYLREDNTTIRIYPYRTSFGLNSALDEYQRTFLEQYSLYMDYCDQAFLPESSALLQKFAGSSEQQQLSRQMSVSELLKQAWLNTVEVMTTVFSDCGIIVDPDIIKCVAISKKYEGYIKRSDGQNSKIKQMDNRQVNWEQLAHSPNISFECRQRISRIKPETFGQLKLIEGIRPATLAVVAARAL